MRDKTRRAWSVAAIVGWFAGAAPTITAPGLALVVLVGAAATVLAVVGSAVSPAGADLAARVWRRPRIRHGRARHLICVKTLRPRPPSRPGPTHVRVRAADLKR